MKKLNTLLLLLLLLQSIRATARVLQHPDIEAEFERWCWKYRMRYASDEERSMRLQNFKRNFEKVKQRNEASGGLYELELNKLADRDSIGGGFLVVKNATTPQKQDWSNATTPLELDWRDRGAVTPVADQAGCGNCWIQASIGALESAYFVRTGDLIGLSTKELNDCLQGCNGGDFDRAYQFITVHGVHRSVDYRKAARTKCQKLPDDVPKLKTSGFVSIYDDDMETAMEQAVARQPIVAGVQSSCMGLYKHGILQQADPNQSGENDHTVLIVGYGSRKGVDYWIIKNSWGTDWGENGYFKLRRHTTAVDGECGVHNDAGYPILNTSFVPSLPPRSPRPRALHKIWRLLHNIWHSIVVFVTNRVR